MRLADAAGKAVADGDYQITFRIYDVDTLGTPLWTETQTVAVTDGVFSALLGSVTALDLAFDAQYWLAIEVASDGEMTPRFELASAPYALRAKEAEAVDWAGVANVPADIAGGDDDTTYTDGTGILISGGAISVDPAEVASAVHEHDAAYVNDGAGEINAANDFGFAASTYVANLEADTLDGTDGADFSTDAELAAHAASADAHHVRYTDAEAVSATASSYVAKSGDTMTGTLNLPADGLAAGTDQLVLSGGNVGIGTAAPATWAKLDVAGTVKSQNVRAQVSATDAVSTTSTTWVDMPDMSLTITTGNSPVLIIFQAGGVQQYSATENRSYFRMLVNGVERATCQQEFHNSAGWALRDVAFNWLETLPEGAHTIKVQWRRDVGGNVYASYGNSRRCLIALEL